MSDEPKKRARIVWTALALLAVVVLYPLSAGPVLWISLRTGLPRGGGKVLDTFYEPLIWLRSKSKTADKAFERYFNVWK
jgi:hypothetical protein